MGRFLTREWRDQYAVRIADELGQRFETLFTFVRDLGCRGIRTRRSAK